MRILIDLGHPAHLHYFRNFMQIMQGKDHDFSFIARDKEVLHKLLDSYNIEYTSRGRGKKSFIGKLFYIIYADYIIFKVARNFQPDMFLSFSSAYTAHVSRLFGKPHIVLDDTEHAKFESMMYSPFSDVILNPSCFMKNFSSKQMFFDSYMELFYLNPKYFSPDLSIINSYGISGKKKYFILRFVSWSASHDFGQKGLSIKSKIKLVHTLEKHGKVLISSEGPIPDVLKSRQIDINPEHLHHFLAFATLCVAEGATIASECAMLGTPNIYFNSLVVGSIKELEEKYGLSCHLTDEDHVIDKAVEIIGNEKVHQEYQDRRIRMLRDKIDGTELLVWFIENYPQSEKIMRINTQYQYNFRSKNAD